MQKYASSLGFGSSMACALIALAGFLALSACGDDAAPGNGCTTDDQCKGDRICVDKQCVDPTAAKLIQIDAGAAGKGAGTAGSSSASGGRAALDSPELEQACSRNCEARQAASCAMTTGSVDQCVAGCLVIDEQNYGYCWDEQTAQYACLASGGYSCVSGYAQPKSTCISETQALSMCSQKSPCRRFCELAAGKCAPSGADCITACTAQQNGFSDAICGVYYGQLLSCWGQTLTCNGSRPSLESCGPAAAEIADCVGRRNHVCDGYCWIADALGCGSSDCATSCRAKVDNTTCGRQYRTLVECTFNNRKLQMTCENGVPTPSAACDSARAEYAKCMPAM